MSRRPPTGRRGRRASSPAIRGPLARMAQVALTILLALTATIAAVPARAEGEAPTAGSAQEDAGDHDPSAFSTAPPDAAGGDDVRIDDPAATVTDALQGRQGIRIQTLCTHCNSANIQVGGLSDELVPISRDGFPVIGGLATTFILNILPADSVAGAQVSKGPGEASSSNAAAGGDISLSGATPYELPWFDATGMAGSFSLLQTAARVSGSLAPWAAGSLVLGRTEADVVDDDHDGWNDVPSVDRNYGEGGLTLTPGEHHTAWFGASYIDEENLEARGAFDVARFISTGEDSWTREDSFFDREEYRAGWSWRPRSGGSLTLRLLRADRTQRVQSQFTVLPNFIPGGDAFIDRFRIAERTSWGNLVYERPVGFRFRIKAGVERTEAEVEAFNIESGGGGGPEFLLERVPITSAHLDAGWSVSPRLDVQLGLRFDEADLTTRLGGVSPSETRRAPDHLSPRLNLRYFPARGWTLRLVAGETFRPPRPILAEVCCGQRYQTTEEVRPEIGSTFGLEAVFQPTPRLRASAYAARTEFEDHILSVVGSSQAFVQTYALANIPRARAERAEVAVRYSPLERLTLDGSFGWLSFKNTGAGPVDVFVSPPSFADTIAVPLRIDRVPYLPVRSGSFSAGLRLPRDVFLSGQAAYTGNMLIQQFTRLPFNSELDTETLRRTPGFWLVNLAAEVPLTRRVVLLLAVANLTDRLQADLGDPTTDYNWGPLTGRAWRGGLKFRMDRQRGR